MYVMKCISLWWSLVALETNTMSEQEHAIGNPCFTWLMPLTAPELAQKRIDALKRVFSNKWWVESHNVHGNIGMHVKKLLDQHGMEFLKSIPPIWRYRLTTSTCQFRHEDVMWYFDAKYLPWDLYFDYWDISDGWVRSRDIRETLLEARQLWEPISMDDYLNAHWWWMAHWDLEKHKIFRAIIPHSTLRREYITCLRILDRFSISWRWKQSLWRPGEIKSWYLRWIALWIKWEAVYPPNATTVDHRIVCHKGPNLAEILAQAGMPVFIYSPSSAKS